MKRIILTFLTLILTGYYITAQVQLTQYFYDQTYYNPSFTGSGKTLTVNGYLRNQWMNLSDQNNNHVAPRSAIINYHSYVPSINSGIGISAIYDMAGFEKNMALKLNYAYLIPAGKNRHLSIGAAVSVLNKTSDFNKIILSQPGDPLINTTGISHGIMPDIDLGIQFSNSDKYFIGASAVNILETKADIGGISHSQKRSFYLSSGYSFRLTKSKRNSLFFTPSMLVKSNLLNAQIDVSGMIEYNKTYRAGLSWRYQDAVAIMAGMNIQGLQIGAAYDLTTSYLSKGSNGSFEIFLGYVRPVNNRKKSSKDVCKYNSRYL